MKGGKTMTENPTPKYNIGDRVEVPHRKLEGEIFDREYSDANGSWIYFITLEKGRIQTAAYQEKSLKQ